MSPEAAQLVVFVLHIQNKASGRREDTLLMLTQPKGIVKSPLCLQNIRICPSYKADVSYAFSSEGLPFNQEHGSFHT